MQRKELPHMKSYINRGVSLVFLKEPHINTDTYKQTLSNLLFPMTNTDVDFIPRWYQQISNGIGKDTSKNCFGPTKEKRLCTSAQERDRNRQRLKRQQMEPCRERSSPRKRRHKKQKEERRRMFRRTFAGRRPMEKLSSSQGISRKTYYKYKADKRRTGGFNWLLFFFLSSE